MGDMLTLTSLDKNRLCCLQENQALKLVRKCKAQRRLSMCETQILLTYSQSKKYTLNFCPWTAQWVHSHMNARDYTHTIFHVSQIPETDLHVGFVISHHGTHCPQEIGIFLLFLGQVCLLLLCPAKHKTSNHVNSLPVTRMTFSKT